MVSKYPRESFGAPLDEIERFGFRVDAEERNFQQRLEEVMKDGEWTREDVEAVLQEPLSLSSRILVERIEEGEQKVGGIIIPDSAKEKPQQGKVVAVGAGKPDKDGKKVALDVQAGDTILFGKYSGQEIKIDGNEYLIMREDEVLAVLEK